MMTSSRKVALVPNVGIRVTMYGATVCLKSLSRLMYFYNTYRRYNRKCSFLFSLFKDYLFKKLLKLAIF